MKTIRYERNEPKLTDEHAIRMMCVPRELQDTVCLWPNGDIDKIIRPVNKYLDDGFGKFQVIHPTYLREHMSQFYDVVVRIEFVEREKPVKTPSN